MGAALLVCRLALASVFVIAGVAKLADLGGTRRAVTEFGVPERLASSAGIILPVLELAVAAALIVASRLSGLAAAMLLVSFSAAIAHANRHGRAPECHCFGQLHTAPAGRATIIRNAALLAPAGFVVAGDWPGAIAGAAAGLALVLIVKAPTSPPRFGLPVGAPAPDFELEDATGATHSLSSLLTGATNLVLVFTDSACTTCRAMLPEIALAQRRARATRVAVVASGVPERDSAELTLLQKDREVADAYRIPGTPMAVVIDRHGRIERPALAGPDAVADALAELVPAPPPARAELGDPIPDLVLPDPHGRRLSLRELYSDPTVVIFWDPHCEFSRQMLPGLSAFEREAPPAAPQLIVISADAPPDRTFASTVLLDPRGEARAAFGATGTPMAVLLSEDQVASPLAPGARTVFNLIDAATLAPR